MNIEYIGIDGAIIDEHFKVPDDMIDRYVSLSKSYLDYIIKPTSCRFEHKYISLGLGFSNFVSAEIQGVYENGVVFKFICHIDNAACKYDDATSAYLIVMDDGSKPIFIINGIDARCNVESLGCERDCFLIKTNKEYVDLYFSKLGKRIDFDNFIVPESKKNISSRRRLQKKVELIQSKIKAKVCKAINKIESSKVIKKKELK